MKKHTHKHPEIIRRIVGNIKSGRFNWANYLRPRNYYNVEICTIPLHCGGWQIGYIVYFPYSDLPQIQYDWEMGIIKIAGDNTKYPTRIQIARC